MANDFPVCGSRIFVQEMWFRGADNINRYPESFDIACGKNQNYIPVTATHIDIFLLGAICKMFLSQILQQGLQFLRFVKSGHCLLHECHDPETKH